MIGLAIAAATLWTNGTPRERVVTLTPCDDVWVYPHASDPGRDEALRIWGSAGRAVAPDPTASEDFSYGYLRFEIPADATGKLRAASLELTNVPNPGMKKEDAMAAPLEVRPLIGTFEEKTFVYTDAVKCYPDAKKVWGNGVPEFRGDENPVPFRIELLLNRSGFSVTPGKPLYLALTSVVDAAEVGMSAIYKVYSKDGSDANRRPKLALIFD